MSLKRMLGKRPHKPDFRHILVPKLLGDVLPFAPSACDWDGPTPDRHWDLNNELGCCTCTAAVKSIRQLTDVAFGSPAELTDADVLEAYIVACGYVPGDPTTDRGGYCSDVLKHWRKVGIRGHKLNGYALIPLQTINEIGTDAYVARIKSCHHLFGTVYIGAGLPKAAQDQVLWDCPNGPLTGDYAPWSWGGHAMNIVGYTRHRFRLATWAGVQETTDRWISSYVDEAWVPLALDDWMMPGGTRAANQWLREELTRALDAVTAMRR